jgi:hypothetical protein
MSTEIKRINVAVTPKTVKALANLAEREGVTLTEALRRLVGYGDFIYRASREDRQTVAIGDGDNAQEVILL